MRIEFLGPLEIGGSALVTAGRDRVVLAMLLLRRGRVVPVDDLVDALWEKDPPATARAQVQTCVSRLRRTLADAGLPAGAITTDPAGYGLRPGAIESDAERFGELVDDARAAAARHELDEASDRFRAALTLWRGPALAGIASRGVRGGAALLDDQRVAVTEECVEVELRLGRAAELVGELTDLVARHPVRERLREQLMRALSATGRQADALAVYRDGRRVLADELGIEPGAALRETHQRILAGRLSPVTPHGRSAPPARCLPRVVTDFTGRAELLGRLRRSVEQAEPQRPVVQLIEGMAGSGKTTLAVQAATAVAQRYPDGQLFVDLHGHSERSPLDPAAALVTLLRQLNVPSDRIPGEVEDRVSLWRTELALRRTLIVLDNAASAAQVTPLLPGSGDCLVLVTSRRRLLGLDGIQPYRLPVLDPDEAVELLARVAGPDRVRAEPAAAAEVVRRCGHLPLAIRLAGARLAHRPRWAVADLASRLRGDDAVLTELAAENRTVANAFALSYAQLTAPTQRLFRLLGLHPGDGFDARSAAALGNLPLPAVRDMLDELVDGHLVEEPEAGRFRFHDLVRDYAAGLAGADPADDRRAAVAGWLDHLLHLTLRVTRPMEPPTTNQLGFESGPPERPDLLPDAFENGLDWLELERTTLVRAVRCAVAHEQDRYAWQLARAQWFFLYLRGYHDDLIDTHRQGIAAARRSGDDKLVAVLRNFLASGHYRRGRWSAAVGELELALPTHVAAGDVVQVGRTRANLAMVLTQMGEYAAAEEHIRLSRQAFGNDPRFVPQYLMVSCHLALQMGRLTTALALARRHLLASRQYGQERQLVTAICNVGHARAGLGHYRPALRVLTAALRLAARTDNRLTEANVLHSLGVTLRGLGRAEEAIGRLHEALRIMREFGDTEAQVDCRSELARAMLDTGDRASSVALLQQALASAGKLRYPRGQARALDGLATCLAATDPEQSRRYWQRALAIFADFDGPEAAAVRRRLAGLSAPTQAGGGPGV